MAGRLPLLLPSSARASDVIVISDVRENPVFVVPAISKVKQTEKVPLNISGFPVPSADLVVQSFVVQAKLTTPPDLDVLSGRSFLDFHTFFDPRQRKQNVMVMKFEHVLQCVAKVYATGVVEVSGGHLRLDTMSIAKMVLDTVIECIRLSGLNSEVSPASVSSVTCHSSLKRAVNLAACVNSPGIKVGWLVGCARMCIFFSLQSSVTLITALLFSPRFLPIKSFASCRPSTLAPVCGSTPQARSLSRHHPSPAAARLSKQALPMPPSSFRLPNARRGRQLRRRLVEGR
jgi:hypothetical protein